ncbi:glutaminyl-peptide cyclotransferase [Corynebacterium pyruviciproducens]|uniref:glutaminyl-peptide cyclotransferase n=1 Tax=Corynebacterium pyruviciproducens TaxID=598660 RepID=UPI0023F43CC3|nr:glutaminyl-peptide cyclotransferase [Corynebacterium pyruviciproducens]
MGRFFHVLTSLICSFAIVGCTPVDEFPAPGSSVGSSVSTASAALSNSSADKAASIPRLRVEVLNQLFFDPSTFTQGLEVNEDGTLLVSHGMYRQSGIYRRTLDGQVQESHRLADQYFGEGFTRVGSDVWMLTWKENTAFRLDAATLAVKETVSYPGEGWGLCSFEGDGQAQSMYMSDGTATLQERDPQTFALRRTVAVTAGGSPVTKLNELSCAPDGSLYANIFLTDEIVRIDPATGEVTGLIDASGLRPERASDPNAVLNGIAHIPETDHFYLSGKMWPTLYEVRFVPA